MTDPSVPNVKILSEERRQKSKVVAVVGSKGGCGKTTTAIALGMYLARTGKNVLFWDNDPKCNLTQRLTRLNENHPDIRRLDLLFAGKNPEDLTSIIKYPRLMRLDNPEDEPGIIGLMAGSDFAEIEANALQAKLKISRYSDRGDRSVTQYFYDYVQFYKAYYDYILMDTAPGEGNILNNLAVRTADEIIYPIDGIEAAFGVESMLRMMTIKIEGNEIKPNGVFVMVRYYHGATIPNSVRMAMEGTFGEFVCSSIVSESADIRNATVGFGRGDEYVSLCREISEKINQPRSNLFDYVARVGFFNKFVESLAEIQKSMVGSPTFRTPDYGFQY